jgi:hypothetical protein
MIKLPMGDEQIEVEMSHAFWTSFISKIIDESEEE